MKIVFISCVKSLYGFTRFFAIVTVGHVIRTVTLCALPYQRGVTAVRENQIDTSVLGRACRGFSDESNEARVKRHKIFNTVL